jgi:cytochrome c-type biogenesis protein CcmH/NrfG
MNAAQKKVKAASSDFLEALKLDPANLPAIEALGEIYGEHDQYKAALSRFDDSLKSVGAKDSPYYYQGRAALESSAGRYKEAIADLTKAAQGGSDPEAVRSSIAQCYFRMGDLPAAYRLYSHLIEDNPQQYELYLKRGNVASKQRRFSLAAADFANAVGLMPDAFEGYMLEGQAHADAKASGLALVCFRHALRLKPNNEEARRKVAECTREKEAERLTAVRPDKDTLAYESMLRLIAASDPSHLKQLSYQALEGGDVDFAVLALTRAIKLKPDDPVLRQYMTSALLTQGKYSQAIDQFLARAQISKLDLTEKLLFAKQIPERDVVSKFYGALIEQYRKDPLALYNIALDCDSQSLVPPAEAAVAAGLKVATDSDRARLLSMQAQLKDKQRQEYEKFSPEDLAKLKSYVQPNRN